jgi:RimJ/RimL family protein N-acetyltransferase
MISLRLCTEKDRLIIQKWPTYPYEFQELDYALRSNGWIDKYQQKKDTYILIADEGSDIIGFSIISREGVDKAEFRIAVHPKKLGRGLGKTIAYLTLKHAFSDLNLNIVRLDVRKNNYRAKRLYETLNFRITGEGIDQINGISVEMYKMEINKSAFNQNQEAIIKKDTN